MSRHCDVHLEIRKKLLSLNSKGVTATRICAKPHISVVLTRCVRLDYVSVNCAGLELSGLPRNATHLLHTEVG